MRESEVISNCSDAGACRGRQSALGCALGLVLAVALSAAGARAQGSNQTRVRRVAESDSSLKKDDAGAVAAKEASAPASATKAMGNLEMEDEPPSLEEEAAGKGDRLGTLRAQIKNAKTNAQRARLQRTLVDYLVALGQQGEAIEQLRLMMKEERFDPVGFYNIGNALARLGDTETAISAYRKAIEQRQGHYARALNNLGVVLLRQGRWEEAQEALKSALRQEAFRYPEASYNLGRLYSLRGEADLAILEWNRVLALQPAHADAALALARALAEDGNPERALQIIDAFNTRHGANKELSAARREILYGVEAGDAEADGETKPAAQSAGVSSNAPFVVTTKATGNSKSAPKPKTSEGSATAAASSSLRSLTVDRETYDLLERARGAREAGEPEEAVNFYNRALVRRGGFLPPANLEISFVLASLNRHEEAIASLQKLVSREGARYPIAYYHLGRRYEMLGRLNAAAEAYGRAAAAYGETEPQFLLDVSRVREREGNIQAALGAMEEYARISERRGRTPEWVAERISQLRQKQTAATAQTPAPAPKP